MEKQKPQISWDSGTAYDLFASLHVLHHPDKFGLRGSWAAGVRSRLTTSQRSILEDAQRLLFISPLVWVTGLPEPKDADTALWSLSQIPPAGRLAAMAYRDETAPEVIAILQEISARQAWDDGDLVRINQHRHRVDGQEERERLVTTLNWWSQVQEYGERFQSALSAYVSVFFAEEEQRIKPYLQQALARGQEQASRVEFGRLFLELSQGVKITVLEQAEEVTLVPSYWITPLVMYDRLSQDHWLTLFGARPAEAALVPGEVVPDALLRALKALSDPTRLLILRYLCDQPQTPSELARRLRLRPPTVIHHLNALRLAGLVYVTLAQREERCYASRVPAVGELFEVLRNFLAIQAEE